jgi:hypothetical protein
MSETAILSGGRRPFTVALGRVASPPGRSDRRPAFYAPCVVSLRDRIPSTRPLWADFVIAVLVFWAVLLRFEYGGTSAVVLAAVVAVSVLMLLLARRWRRRM